MECNKEEAVRAREIAETKMQSKDFLGAHRFVLKAQQLFPHLENISQMLTVCDVHCAADRKMIGNEMDWYGILQVEEKADEALIKKQYRKLALLLHPDKNKFAGAESAFKLIGESQRVLLDKVKRSLHDMRRRATLRTAAPNQPPQQASRNSNVGKQPGVQNNFNRPSTSRNPGMNAQQQQPQPQAQYSNGRQTFWTVCPFCGMKFNFYIETFKKSLVCLNCKKPFVAYDMSAQDTQTGTARNQPAFPQQKEILNEGTCKVGSHSTSGNPASNMRMQEIFAGENSTVHSFQKAERTTEVDGVSKTYGEYGNVDKKTDMDERSGESKASKKVNGKRGSKQVEESSESFDTGSSTDPEGDAVIEEDGDLKGGPDFGSHRERYPRRSTRHKQQVTYDENFSEDEDFVSPPKKAKGSRSSFASEEGSEDSLLKGEASKMNEQSGLAADVKEGQKQMKQKEGAFSEESSLEGNEETKEINGKQTDEKDGFKKSSEVDDRSVSSSSPRASAEPEVYECPDPDFSNFDKGREEGCFKVGQMWAIYDTLDAMPRFYALIRKVFSPGFKLRITWLEANPDDEDEIKWAEKDLPVSCGKFSLGDSENAEDICMFSHPIDWEKGRGRNSYKIYPRKGETWALFKNWNINWNSELDGNRKYEYEFVEVLSDYIEGIGIHVVFLGKVKGFVSLFDRIVKEGIEALVIPQSELLRFSHRIPSFKMTGEERGDVPKGSFELDPASLPVNLKAVVLEDFKMDAGNVHPDGFCSKSAPSILKTMMPSEGSSFQADEKTYFETMDGSSDNVIKDCDVPPASTPECYEIPEPEFFDFDTNKSPEKFQTGQIWALYSDQDGLPKYYGQIKKIDSHPAFKLHVVWLVACSQKKEMIQWLDKDMPICCGRFKIKKGKPETYTATNLFSHQLRAEPAGKKDEYIILPRKGEVWALYKNWNAQIKCSDLENCEYDIVEVLEESDLQFEVLILERVDGFNSVFKHPVIGESAVTTDIPQVELLRFSHQIPAFRLTEERGGSLRGSWELDPASLPVILFCTN